MKILKSMRIQARTVEAIHYFAGQEDRSFTNMAESLLNEAIRQKLTREGLTWQDITTSELSSAIDKGKSTAMGVVVKSVWRRLLTRAGAGVITR